MKKREPMRRYKVRMPSADIRDIRRLARQEGKSVSAWARTAVQSKALLR